MKRWAGPWGTEEGTVWSGELGVVVVVVNEARVEADIKVRRKEKGRRLGARGKTGLNWIFGLRPLD